MEVTDEEVDDAFLVLSFVSMTVTSDDMVRWAYELLCFKLLDLIVVLLWTPFNRHFCSIIGEK